MNDFTIGLILTGIGFLSVIYVYFSAMPKKKKNLKDGWNDYR